MCVVVAPAADAPAKPGKAAEKQTKTRAKKTKKRKRANMPVNWQWPPSTQMKASGAKCLTELTELGVTWEAGEATKKVAVPIVVPDMNFGGLLLTPIFRKPPFVLDCHLALALTRMASDVLAAGISELRFSSIHDYRNVRKGGRTKSSLSRHALGLAVDVYEFVTDDGTKVVVEDDYTGSPFAHALEATLLESGQLRALLTPGNDRSHHDHFHLEAPLPIAVSPKRKRE